MRYYVFLPDTYGISGMISKILIWENMFSTSDRSDMFFTTLFWKNTLQHLFPEQPLYLWQYGKSISNSTSSQSHLEHFLYLCRTVRLFPVLHYHNHIWKHFLHFSQKRKTTFDSASLQQHPEQPLNLWQNSKAVFDSMLTHRICKTFRKNTVNAIITDEMAIYRRF